MQAFIGLEIHVQLLTESKVFCGCRAAFGDRPNTNVCPVCMGYPGVLPMLNRQSIVMAYGVAAALDCTLAERAYFERKNYFYPDLPKNYQISQYSSPVGTAGYLELQLRKRKKRVQIREVHLEEDAGKMIHAGDVSLLDFNRAGTPLLEIVTMPDLESGEEAELLLQNLRRLVRYLEVCDGNMEQGSLRCDANVSVNYADMGPGQKVEIKNLNSFKFVRKALAFEIDRQAEILERGGQIRPETRLWNENRDVTESMRVKESAFDYRYFPDPDLPPFVPDAAFLESVRKDAVELPQTRKQRFVADYALSEAQAEFISDEKEMADFFEQAAAHGAEPRAAALWLASDVKKLLNRLGVSIRESRLTPECFAELLSLLERRVVHGRIAKRVLEVVFAEGTSPSEIIKREGWEQINSPQVIEKILSEVAAENPDAVAGVRSGDSKPLGYLIGEIMKATSGRAEPGTVQQVLKDYFALSFIQVFSMGGAITGRMSRVGDVVPGDSDHVVRQLEKTPELSKRIRLEEVPISRILSEEIVPRDWATLVGTLQSHLRRGDSSGVVVAHGTDTLAYTASLLFWFFPRPPVPVVLTASIVPPGIEGTEDEAMSNLVQASLTASEAAPGTYVVFGGTVFSPLNLKFERISSSGFRNWNMERHIHTGRPIDNQDLDLSDTQHLTQCLETAINKIAVLKVYPGMRGDFMVQMMESGIRYFVLELFDTGTANLRESPYSLRRAFIEGRERGVQFFCTSQQEGIVDFSRYFTSHELWREGAIPMGFLTTESAYTRLLVALVVADSEEEVAKLMEEANAAPDI